MHRRSKTPALDFFERSYITEPNSGCWLWEAGASKAGYGLIQCADYYGFAHRYSYTKFKGNIPKGKFVCHKCDMPPCVNPDHLWLGSHADNMQDCARKGRNISAVCPELHARGEKQHLAVLTEALVIEVRNLYGTLDDRGLRYTLKALAELSSVSLSTMHAVIKRKTWKHI